MGCASSKAHSNSRHGQNPKLRFSTQSSMLDEMKSTTYDKDDELLAWDIKIPLKDELKDNLPFERHLPSEHVTGVVLSYIGNRNEVCILLRILSHTSRAYCVQ